LVGADSGNFSKLLNEERGPSRSLAVAIEREFGVKVSWWDEEVAEEGPSVDPRAAGTGAEGR
jgi:hypothetical protein